MSRRWPFVVHLPAFCVGLLWLGLACWIVVAEHETYNTTSRDFGVYLQVLWDTGHGRPFLTSLLEFNRVHLAEHVALLLPLLAPLYALFPDPRWLLVGQQVALALSGIPVYLLARRMVGGVWLPTLLVAGFFAMPTLDEVAFDALYPVTFAALPMAFGAYFLITGRWRRGAACGLLALLIEEEAGLTVAGLGIFLLLSRRTIRWAPALLVASAVWLGLVGFVVMPRFHEPSTAGENRTLGHFEHLRQSPGEAVGTFLTRRSVLAARWLLAPTGGLALLAPEVLAIDLPHAATLLLADKEGRYRRHWAAPMLPAIWLAAVVGLARLGKSPLRLAGIGLLVVGSVASYLVDSSLPGGGDYEPEDVVWTERAEQLSYLAAAVPPDASLAASRRPLGHVANRSELYVFPPNYGGRLWPPDRRVQAYLLDLTNDQTREALAGRQSPLRASRPYALWLAGQDALLLTDRPSAPSRLVGQDLANLRLVGYDARRDASTLEVVLHWQSASGAPTRPLARVVRLVDDSGQLQAEQRGMALDGLFPTQEWPGGQLVLDRVRLPSPPGQRLRLEVGWLADHGTTTLLELPLDLMPSPLSHAWEKGEGVREPLPATLDSR